MLYADIVLPSQYFGEHEDIITSLNYTVFMHELIQPLYQSLSDLEIVQGIANNLSATVAQQVFQSKTMEQWVEYAYAATNVPLTMLISRQRDTMPTHRLLLQLH